jgi:hypothetical protein
MWKQPIDGREFADIITSELVMDGNNVERGIVSHEGHNFN